MSKSTKAYEAGLAAFAAGVKVSANPHHPAYQESRAWRDGWNYAHGWNYVHGRKAEDEAGARIDNVAAAIEALIDAKIRDARHAIGAAIDVRETREHLRDKLSELMP